MKTLRRIIKILVVSTSDEGMILNILDNIPEDDATTIKIYEEDLSVIGIKTTFTTDK
jgi:hypothetical protein